MRRIHYLSCLFITGNNLASLWAKNQDFSDTVILQKLIFDTQKEPSARNRLRLAKENGSQRSNR